MTHNPRFSILQGRAVKDRRISDPQFRTLADLGTYTDNEGWCFPSLKTLGEDLGKSPQAVSKDIEALVKFDYIEKHKRLTKEKGNIANRYRLRFDAPYQPEIDRLSTSGVDRLSTSEVEGRNPEEGTHSKRNTRRSQARAGEPFQYEWPPEVQELGVAFESIWSPAKKPTSGGEYAYWLHGNKRSGAHGLMDYKRAGILADDITRACVYAAANKLMIANPNSLYNLAFDAMTRRIKQNGGKSLSDTQAERRAEFENSKPLEE